MQLTHPLALVSPATSDSLATARVPLPRWRHRRLRRGYVSMANPFIGYGLTLITFYLTGSRATKFKRRSKASLKRMRLSLRREREREGIRRGETVAVQVLCNSLTAVLACIAYRLGSGGDVDPLSRVVKVVELAGTSWEVTNLMLTMVIGGHYAACMGDTQPPN